MSPTSEKNMFTGEHCYSTNHAAQTRKRHVSLMIITNADNVDMHAPGIHAVVHSANSAHMINVWPTLGQRL